jgi:hypothetical protein
MSSNERAPRRGARGSFCRRCAASFLSDPAAVSFLAAVGVLFLGYRLRLALALLGSAHPPLGVERNAVHALGWFRMFASDLVVALILGAGCFALRRFLQRRLGVVTRRRFLKLGEIAAGAAALTVVAFLMLTHHRLIFEVESGINLMLLQVGATELGRNDALRLMTPGDFVFLAVPTVALLAFRRWPGPARGLVRRGGFAAALLAALGWLQPWSPRLAPELWQNPLHYLGRDLARAPWQFYFGQANPFAGRADLPGPAQLNSVRLIDEAFVFTNAPGKPPLLKPLARPADPAHWNVLFLILESTGADYVFDTSAGHDIPMPFLRQMADQGLFFAHHHAACNSSGNALQSILSGLYPRPTSEVFSHLDEAAIPLVNRWLRGTHYSFLLHPSRYTYSFPAKLFENNHLDEIYYYEKLAPGPGREYTPIARNEVDVVSFLLQKLDTVREPFCGVYWSFVPHHPYSDYGPPTRVRPDVKDKRHRYYNNLRLLDTQLRRVHAHLRERGLLDRTILIFVGDHGEAFGQHPGTWAHIGGSFSETYRVPLIFYQPRLIQPQTVTRVTSHVDILPTLFDLMGVDWDENKFQGESALRESRRRYIFSMDCLAEYMSTVDNHLNKVSIGFEHGRVYAYNLARDPGEMLPLTEDPFQAHLEAIVKFRNYQTHLINTYNAAIRSGKPFP